METLRTRNAEAAATAVPTGTLTHPLANWPRELAPGLHPQVLAMFIGAYAAMLLVLWLFFGTDVNAAIALGVCTVYFGMYFGVPLAMLRLAGKTQQPASGSLGRFLDGDLDTYTGPVSGWGVIAQLMTIPVGLTAAFVAFGVIIRLGA